MTSASARRRAIEAQPSVGTWVRVRVYIAAGLLTLGLIAIAYKAYSVQIVHGARYRELARRQHLRTVEVPAPRGVIYDAGGKELAITADVDSVFCNPREVVDVAGSAERLAELLDLDVRVVESKLSSRRYFEWLRRHVNADQAAAVRAANLPGVGITQEPRRYYPNKGLAGPLLGFADIDGIGLDGIELAMNDLLQGKRAKLAALRDARGRTMLNANEDVAAIPQAVAGAAITLTIDSFIQFASERALAAAVEEHDAVAGTVLVLDVRTGGVLAMASWPTYDPNDPKGRLAARRGARNRAVTDAHEVGSMMKVFTVAAALEAGAVRPNQLINVEKGRYKVGRKTFRDTHHDEILSVGGVIKRSSNVGAIKIAQALGADKLHAAFVRYGFGTKTGIELPGERPGVLRPPERWGQIGLATHSFGHGMTTTALQIGAALAAIGNGGVLHEPRIVAQVTDADGTVRYLHKAAGRRIMTEETAAALLPMLESVFEKGKDGGTARGVEVPGFRVGGKTGTAHKLDPNTHRYAKDVYLASFMGLAPIDDPRLAIVVMIDEPRGEHHYGGKVAGPVFGRIAAESLRYLGVPSTEPEPADDAPAADVDLEESDLLAIETAPITGAVDSDVPAEGQVSVPSFVGLSMGAALQQAREHGIEVDVEGTGRVADQFPPPGVADRGVVIRLVFTRN